MWPRPGAIPTPSSETAMPDKSRWAGLRPDRRAFLTMIGAGAVAAPAVLRPARAAEDPILEGLIEQNQRKDLGQDFDSASRTIPMPKASLPTLSPSTADTTAQAVGEYEGILARGGWP